MITLGIDPSLNGTGWAILDCKEIKDFGVIRHKANATRLDKFETIVFELNNILKKFQPDLIAIEEQHVFFNRASSHVVSEVIGLITGAVIADPFTTYQFVTVNMKSARAGVGCKSMKKEDVTRHVRYLFFGGAEDLLDHNEADAIITGYYAHCQWQTLA